MIITHFSAIITSLRVSVPTNVPIAGHTFTLVCESVEHVNTSGFPTITWLDAQGKPISSYGPSGPIYISNSYQDGIWAISSLEFRPLKASFSQEYTCEINFSNIGLVKTHSYDLQVIGMYTKYNYRCIPLHVHSNNNCVNIVF